MGRGPAKSNRTSSFGSTTGSIWNECSFPINGLRFYFVQCKVGSSVPSDYGACMSESHTCWHRFNIAADSGWGKGMLSNTVHRRWAGIIFLLSTRRQSSRTCSLFVILNHYCPYEILIASQSRFLREIE